MSDWYYETLGKVVGPLTAKELLVKVRSGEVGPSTPVRKDDSQWVDADEINGLFEAATRPLIEHICPYCGTKVGKPPVTCSNCTRYLDRTYTTANAKNGKLSRKKASPSKKSASSDQSAPPSSNGDAKHATQPRRLSLLQWLKSWWEDVN